MGFAAASLSSWCLDKLKEHSWSNGRRCAAQNDNEQRHSKPPMSPSFLRQPCLEQRRFFDLRALDAGGGEDLRLGAGEGTDEAAEAATSANEGDGGDRGAGGDATVTGDTGTAATAAGAGGTGDGEGASSPTTNL